MSRTTPAAVMPRQGVSARQAETVARLVEAAEAELRDRGGEGVSVRSVARRAGVSSGTAYTYFASKGHLFAELFQRHLGGLGGDVDQLDSDDPVVRVQAVTDKVTGLLIEFPALADVVTPALLGADPDVARVRLLIGADIMERFERAVGPGADPILVEALTQCFLGGLLSAGMGLTTYAQLASRMRQMVATIMRGNV